MATIKDIAKLAGVSQGTVSNVLNKKDNVSISKINKVIQAAKELGYVPNKNAKNLRKGYTDKLHLILPNITSQTYSDIYRSFNISATKSGLEINLMISDDDIEKEFDFINNLSPKLESSTKIAVVTSLPYGTRYDMIHDNLLNNILFIERDYIDSIHFLGFDYELASKSIIETLSSTKHSSICLISNQIDYSNESVFINYFKQEFANREFNYNHIFVDNTRLHQSLLDQLHNINCDAFITFDYNLAIVLKDIISNFINQDNPRIFTTSPLFVVPRDDLIKYEMSYRLLGHTAAEELKKDLLETNLLLLKGEGIRDWSPLLHNRPSKNTTLRILSVDNPSANTLVHLSSLYTKYTDTKVEVIIKSYDEMYRILSCDEKVKDFDIIRLDINWMSWFAEDVFTPLNMEDSSVKSILQNTVDGIISKFLVQNNQLYGLPYSPSSMVLYYRKDLFERFDIKRQFKEKYKKELTVPKTFSDFNLVSTFFSRDFNKLSPTKYGTTLTVGNNAVSGSEVLARYYEKSKYLLNEEGTFLNRSLFVDSIEQVHSLKNTSSVKYCDWWSDTSKEFSKGDIAMSLIYSNYAPEFLSFDSKIAHKVGHAPVPGNNPLIGGGVLGIAIGSNNQKIALDFIVWLCKDTVTSLAALLGNPPYNKNTFDYYEIIDMYPWYKTTKRGLEISDCSRGPNNFYKYNEKILLDIIGRSIKNMSFDTVSPDDNSINKIEEDLITNKLALSKSK